MAMNVAQRCDALDLLRSLSDACTPAIFFDPQHRSGLNKLKYGNEGARQKERALLPAMTDSYIDDCCHEAVRVLVPSGYLMLWADPFRLLEGYHFSLSNIFERADLISWDDTRVPGGNGYRSRRCGGYLIGLQKPPKRARATWRDHAIRDHWSEKVDRKIHPHIKPIRLIARLIGAITRPGDLVVDPCAGSFAVLAAARVLGRDFVGGDLAYTDAQPIRSYFTEDKMTVRTELMAALDSWTSDGSEAVIVIDKIFARARTILHEHLSDKSSHEVDLLLADLKRDTREELHDLLHNTVDRDEIVDLVIRRYFGED
jgi:site-specific DNA-methyltransferase (adenine-specific)